MLGLFAKDEAGCLPDFSLAPSRPPRKAELLLAAQRPPNTKGGPILPAGPKVLSLTSWNGHQLLPNPFTDGWQAAEKTPFSRRSPSRRPNCLPRGGLLPDFDSKSLQHLAKPAKSYTGFNLLKSHRPRRDNCRLQVGGRREQWSLFLGGLGEPLAMRAAARLNLPALRWLIQSPLHYLFPFRLAGFDEVLTDGALSPSRTPRETPALHPCTSACSTPSSAFPKSTATGTN